jgi:hypothetical protein
LLCLRACWLACLLAYLLTCSWACMCILPNWLTLFCYPFSNIREPSHQARLPRTLRSPDNISSSPLLFGSSCGTAPRAQGRILHLRFAPGLFHKTASHTTPGEPDGEGKITGHQRYPGLCSPRGQPGSPLDSPRDHLGLSSRTYTGLQHGATRINNLYGANA